MEYVLYVICIYDEFGWVGIVEDIRTIEMDVKVKFMHPHGPSKQFFWPPRDDVCWIPFDKVVKVIQLPSTTSGRMYTLTDLVYQEIIDIVML